MKCTGCKTDFCWLCKKDWKGHSGSYYSCKEYNEQKDAGKLTDEQQSIINNQNQLQKYTVYKEAYNLHKKAICTMRGILKDIDANGVSAEVSKFLVENVNSMMLGHRLLQWYSALGRCGCCFVLMFLIPKGPTA